MLVSQGYVSAGTAIRVRNVGGTLDVVIDGTEDDLYPTQSGNATMVYEADIDPEAILNDSLKQFSGTINMDEVEAWDNYRQQNSRHLASAGVAVAD